MNIKIQQWMRPIIAKRYLAGETTGSLAREYGVCERTILIVLHTENVSVIQGPEFRRKALRHDYFQSIDTENKAYWLGFLVADGCLSGSKVSICLKGDDLQHLEKFRKAIGSEHAIGKIQRNNCISVAVRSQRMVDDLVRLGLSERKTGHEVVPRLPTNLMAAFYRGYFDGDGCVHQNKEKNKSSKRQWTLILSSASESLVRSFSEWTKAQIGRSGSKHHRLSFNCWSLAYTGNRQAPALARLLYQGSGDFLGRKRILVQTMLETLGMEPLASDCLITRLAIDRCSATLEKPC